MKIGKMKLDDLEKLLELLNEFNWKFHSHTSMSCNWILDEVDFQIEKLKTEEIKK